MSLLLDALKRAEQEKHARQGANEAEAPAPGRVLELQPMAAPGVATAKPEAHARGAQAMFDAKAATARTRGKRGLLVAAAIAVVLLVGGIGGYVWYSIQALAPKASVQASRPAAQPAPAAVSPAAAPETTSGNAVAAPATAPGAGNAGPDAPTPAAGAAAIVTPAPAPARPADSTNALLALMKEAPPAAQPPAAPVNLARSTAPSRMATDLAAGYAALRANDAEGARRAYQAALSAEPGNLDALLGLATVEARAGARGAAQAHYRRVLELDPRNPTALAALATLADHAHPETLEAQLRQDLARQPENAALHAALGNLHASQSRWGEAQAAYFEAFRLQPQSADVAFNLAIALDHLGQRRLAADYYRRAAEGAQVQAAQFDPAVARRRLAELER